MAKRNYGRIINIASIAGKEGNAGMLAYSSSKAAVIGLTKVTGKEYAETGITVNAVAPAVVRTAMVDAMPDSQVKYMTDKIPSKYDLVSHLKLRRVVCFSLSHSFSVSGAYIYSLYLSISPCFILSILLTFSPKCHY